MKNRKSPLLPFAGLLLLAIAVAHAGQALVLPLQKFLKYSALVAIVDVKSVHKVELAASGLPVHVYVAEAEVVEVLKGDFGDAAAGKRIAIVGSTLPQSSAVWVPIEQKKYLAFLNREQGHWTYNDLYFFRPIDENGKVDWFEYHDNGEFDLVKAPIAEAVQKIKSEQARLMEAESK